MPNLSRQTSNVARSQPDEYKSKTNYEANAENTVTDNAQEWFYGTEELLNALPKVWTRSLLYTVLAFTAVVLPWTMLAKVDETGSARGRIEPFGATQKLDTAVGGNVTTVRAKTGEKVKAGQVLLELESDVLRTELQQTEAKLEGLQNQSRQLALLKHQIQLALGVQEGQNKSQELEKLSQINQAQQNLDTQQTTNNLQILEKQAQIKQAQQKIDASQNDYQLAQSRLQRDLAEVSRFRQLVKAGVVPQTKVVELEKTAEESQQLLQRTESEIKQAQLNLLEEQSRTSVIIKQADAGIKQAKLRLEEQQSNYQSVVNAGQLAVLRNQAQLEELRGQIAAVQSQIIQTKTQIAALNLQLRQRVVRSPIDGVIFDMPVSKPGTVLQPGEMVAKIAPKNTSYVLKAEIPSQNSGGLKVGMPVKVKFDAYPFQEYGVVPGRVSWMAPDSKATATPGGKIETFDLEITLPQPYIQSGNQKITLAPGQTATAEVIVRQRRVIDYMLDPFLKLQKDGLQM
jgi:HlyD family secretion protein